jgi:RimJ/RimL family protein N-acetyltransferase
VVPLIETARLRLRAFKPEDLDGEAAMLVDPVIYRFLGGKPKSREDSWRRLLSADGLWNMLGYGYWAVERKSDGLRIGQVGFADFKRTIDPSIEGIPEMGWIFGVEGQGQGFALEAGQAALDWAERALGETEIAAIIDPGNERSIRLAEKLGFLRACETTYNGDAILLMRRPAGSPAAAAATATPAA